MTTQRKERVALVTGGGRGIGVAIARRLAELGHPVVVNYASSAGAADSVVRQIEADGGTAMSWCADVSDQSAVQSMFNGVAAAIGAPTILVNNAGISEPAAMRHMAPASWDRTLAVNLSGAFYCTHAALPVMYDHGWGRVVFLGSPGGGRTIAPWMTAYAAAKAGLVAMAKALALEVAHRGITVNTVVPGYVATDMVRSSGDAVVAQMDRTWPRVPPSGVADLVAFLVSDEAAYVSGEDIAAWLGGPAPFRESSPT